MANLYPIFERPLTDEEHRLLAEHRAGHPIRTEDQGHYRAIRLRERKGVFCPHPQGHPAEHFFRLDDYGLGHFVRPTGLPLAGRTEKGAQVNAILDANADLRRLFANGLRQILVGFEWK